jgi:phospho-N-acetylmuramoyl-pentapeptide-transferase
MLYHLLAPLARQHIFFNLFNYITFRAAGATVTALLLAFIVGPWIIRKLQEHKIGQIVRA